MAMIWGSGLPYQMASVPHSTRLRADPPEQLPQRVRGLVGWVSNCRHSVATSTHTLSLAGTPWRSSAASSVSIPIVAVGS